MTPSINAFIIREYSSTSPANTTKYKDVQDWSWNGKPCIVFDEKVEI